MEFDIGLGALSAFIFFLYGIMCIVSIIFTFFIETYHKLDEALKLNIVSARILSPLDINIDVIDSWLFAHNKLIGPLLILFCLIDMKLTFNVLNSM